MKSHELLEIYESKELADRDLHALAKQLTHLGLTDTHGVYSAPVIKHQPRGNWGVYLKSRRAS